MKQLTTLLCSLILLFTIFNNTALADDSKLVGHWKGGKISLNLKANHTYTYKVKVLTFHGKWSASKSAITLHYSLLGIKKKKVSSYHFKGNDLVLKQKGKGSITLKKQ